MGRGRNQKSVVVASVVAPTKPTVTAPATGADVYPGVAVTVSATVTAGQVPDRVDFVLDPGGSEVVVATDSSSPYSQSWTPAQSVGNHTLVARYVYGSGHVDSDPINISIFNPTYYASLAAWFDPNDLAVGAVTTWTRKAGSIAWAPTQGTAGKRPSAVAGAGIAGGNVVRFTAASAQYLRDSTGALNQPSTVLTLVKPTALPGTAVYNVLDAGAELNARRIYNENTVPNIIGMAGTTLTAGATKFQQSIWTKVGAVYNGASGIVRAYNATNGTNQATGNIGTATATGISLGVEGQFDEAYFDGDMGHVVVLAEAIDAVAIDRIFAWMAASP